MSYTSAFPPVYVTVDVVLLTLRADRLHVLMVERGSEPWRGWLALPGGFVRQDEDLPEAARRELREETGLAVEPVHLEQLGTFGRPDRDPRARTVAVAHLAVLPALPEPVAGTDAAGASWQPVEAVLDRELPFDHHDILLAGVERARGKLEYTTLATAFAGPTFTIAELRHVYETVWGRPLDPGNFHRKVVGAPGFVERAPGERSSGRGRPAAVYRAGTATLLNPPLWRGEPATPPSPLADREATP
ncbi:8-oxo-dGTP diphosphatase [Friedmanniella luteola]|uniref:8-oxo-dGTP diphosphatase n=1 Tax=Friedmanniella luteola TaxID=546871 RepID=A0A1H1ZIL1_9ACTN|nr:NUDIX domain-containing protein [Friedmanniella luteola]SDT33493.1 8-oxo-dGTP diphosphatase [Friedmanniella luteola]